MQLEVRDNAASGKAPAGPESRAGAAPALVDERTVRGGPGLSAKLLILTLLFVMLAEVLIFLPSVANFRVNWLVDRLTAARVATLSADAVPDHTIPPAVRAEILGTVKVRSVAIKQNKMRRLVLPPDGPLDVARTIDLRHNPNAGITGAFFKRIELIFDALTVLVGPANGIVRIIGHPVTPMGTTMFGPDDFVEIVMDEAPVREALLAYGLNILGLSVIISMIAAALVYFALNRLLVQPMMRIKDNMVAFSRDPENASLIITPSERTDEIGTAERELAHMQQELRSMLAQKSHLAALGLAVSKINHDLRNLLASAQLLSDRLGSLPDPTVQSFAPKLIASLDRAINLCNDTLRYGRAEESSPRRELFVLADLVDEVAEGLGLPRAGVDFKVAMEPDLKVDADRDHLYRVLNNLVRNAEQALDAQPPGTLGEITVRALRNENAVVCEVSDSGPGVPPKARDNLFRAFQGGVRKGGSGLGLAIAAELIGAHGGRLELMDTPQGASFRIEIPDRRINT